MEQNKDACPVCGTKILVIGLCGLCAKKKAYCKGCGKLFDKEMLNLGFCFNCVMKGTEPIQPPKSG